MTSEFNSAMLTMNDLLTNSTQSVNELIDAKKEAGYSITELRELTTKHWQLPEPCLQFISIYFLRKWRTTNALALVKDGTINYEGTKYQLVWYRGKVEATANHYCWLSFRKALSCNVQPIVIIKQASRELKEGSN